MSSMKLHKRTFRSVPNSMFVQKSQEAVEGGSSDLIINELPLSQEEVATLLQNRPVVLEAIDPRIELFNTSDILTVTLFGDKYSAFVMKNPDSATARFLTFQVFSSIFVLALFEEEGIYSLNFLTDEFVSSERISDLENQINNLDNEIGDCIKYAEIDDELSATSTNPVQNKVIYEALQGGGGGSSLYEHRITIAFYNSEGWDGHLTFTVINSSSTAITFSGLKTYLHVENPLYFSMLSANGLIRVSDSTPYFMLIMGIEDTDYEDQLSIRAVDLNAYSADSSEPMAYPINEEATTIYDTIKQIS